MQPKRQRYLTGGLAFISQARWSRNLSPAMISTPLAPRSEGVRTTKPWLKRCRRNSRMSYPDGVSFRGYGGLTLNKLHRQSANLEKTKVW